MAYVILPNSGQSLGVTRPQINQNFSLIKSVFEVNHWGYNDAQAGKHKFVTMPAQTPPVILAGEGAIYSNTVAGASQLFYIRDAGASNIQLTGPITAAATGTTFLPGGIILKWGTEPLSSTGDYPITFATAFPNNLFVVVGLVVTTNTPTNVAFLKQGSKSVNGFTIKNASSTLTGIDWLAIGN